MNQNLYSEVGPSMTPKVDKGAPTSVSDFLWVIKQQDMDNQTISIDNVYIENHLVFLQFVTS